MGCYINPPTGSKEAWLIKHGQEVPLSQCKITEDKVPVCLVDNGAFRAAGVAFSQDELNAFARPDGRPKMWFMVSREDARSVSDLVHYER